MVTVYSKPACVQCTATYRELDKRGVEYEVVDLSQDSDKLEMFRSKNFLQAPIVVSDDGQEWYGFRPDLIGDLPSGKLD